MKKIYITMKAKKITIWSIVAMIFSALVGVSIYGVVRPKKHLNFIVSSSAAWNSMNYVKESSGTQIYSSVVEGLIVPSPNGVATDKSDSLTAIVGAKNLDIRGSKIGQKTFDSFEKTPSSVYKISDIKALTYGMASEVVFSSNNDDPKTLGKIWRFKIREAYWENGDRISAEDFVQTIKYAINLKNGSTLIRTFRDAVPIYGVKDLIKEQQDYYKKHHKYRLNLSDYRNYTKVFSINGGVWSASNPDDESTSFKAYKDAPQKSSSYLYYKMEDKNNSVDLYMQMGNPLFLPTNKHFIDSIGGIDKFGQSKDTILSNGPFNIEKYNLDYQVILARSPSYWDKERVISSRWAYRVIADLSSSIQLFKEGKLSGVRVPDVYLKSFRESPKLNTYLTHGGTAPSTTFIKWNLSVPNEFHPDIGPANSQVANDPFFRRAISFAINRKQIIDIKGLGNTTPSGDIFASPLYRFTDANNNNLEDYLYRMNYIYPSGKRSGKMIQFNPKESIKFRNRHFINNIKNDKYHDKSEAKWNLEQFIKRHPEFENSKIPLKLMFDTSDKLSALMIKQQIEETFKDKIYLTIKPYPSAIFNLKISQNKDFDIAVGNQTPDYQTDAWTFLRMLASPPAKELETYSTINATGNWSFYEGYKWLQKNDPQRLNYIFDQKFIKKMPPKAQNIEQLLKNIHDSPQASTYGNTLTSNEYGMTNSQKMLLYSRLEMLIRDQAPVIPLYHASSLWFARRILGATGIPGFPIQYKYAYNANDVPDSKFSLPGIEALSKSD